MTRTETSYSCGLLKYLEELIPFNIKSKYLVDISTGILYPKTTAHKAQDIGNDILKKMNGKVVKKYKFKKVEKNQTNGRKCFNWQIRGGV